MKTARSFPTQRIPARPLKIPLIGLFAADTAKLFPSSAATVVTS